VSIAIYSTSSSEKDVRHCEEPIFILKEMTLLNLKRVNEVLNALTGNFISSG
jgi:hypothetical protein